MSLLNSLFTGVSGLRTHQTMMDVIGNNIANVNSLGYKGSRVSFADTFSQFQRYGTNPTDTNGGTNTFQLGLGVQVSSIDRNWSQGTMENTGISTDLGLQGNGMFILQKDGQRVYSRAGNFSFDSNGTLVNSQNGAEVQGKMASAVGVLPTGNSLTKIQIDPNMKLPASATTQVKWGGNLSSSATLTGSENAVESGNINNALAVGGTATENNTIYDSTGNSYSFATTYTKTGTDAYNLSYTVKDSTGATILSSASPVAVTFDPATGKMATMNGAAPAAINLTDATKGINFNYDPKAVTQTASNSTLTSSVDSGRTPTAVTGTLTVFDSLGNSHTLTMKYTKSASNNWNWSASLPSGSGTLTGNSGTISFNQDGSINTISPNPPTLAYTPTGGAAAQNIQLDFGSGFAGITQTSSTSAITPLSQNGMASASLLNLNVDQNGKVVGVFSNGESKDLAQVMLANFTNLNGLTSAGDNLYQVSANSGEPSINEAGEAAKTTIQSGALEQSNVDLSEEFTRMIVSQRGFQANARTITVSDSLLQEITNLVR